MTAEEVTAIISTAIHGGCGTASLDECGAGDAHDADAEAVFDALQQAGVLK
jgi:hypothetical protein